MPDRCKDLFQLSMDGTADPTGYIDKFTGVHKEWSEAEQAFLFNADGSRIIRTFEDFTVGLKVCGKLRPKRIKGGIVLLDSYYEMR